MRTQKEIDDEISKLKEMKPRVLKRSAFGDDHHDSIDAQLRVLEGEITEEDVDDVADEEEWADNVRDEANNAVSWMYGESDDIPSEGWKSLIR